MNVWTCGNGAAANAVEVSHRSSESLSHVTALPPCPASMIALRAFSETLTTRAFRRRIWSAKVGTSSRRALSPFRHRRAVADRRGLLIVGARHLFPASRSHQAFWTIPCGPRIRPVATVAWPGHVTVVR